MAPDRHAASHEQPPRPARPDGPTTVACPDDPVGGKAGAAAAPVLGDDCWILSGPTASGKTALALPLARRLDAEIVSVDSMAVYRGLDIGTAKPTAEQRAAVPHHLVDVVEPGEAYSVARWLADAAEAVESIRGRGRRVLFVGGTPLYLRALRDGLDPRPGGDAAVRQRLHTAAEREGLASLYERLAALDPAAASRIHPHDLRRIVRGLEVVETAGEPLPGSWQASRPEHPTFSRRMMVVDVPRRLLRDRIDRRVEEMFAGGIVAETRAALARPGGIGHTASQAAGYAEAVEVLAGIRTERDAVRRTQERTRQLAKRQLTWLRSFRSAVWIGA